MSSDIAPVSSLSKDDPSQEKQNKDPVPTQPHGEKKLLIPDKKTFPLVLVGLLCLISCIVTIYYARGRLVSEWIPNHRPAVQPMVLLALFTGIFGLCTKLIFASGVSIV